MKKKCMIVSWALIALLFILVFIGAKSDGYSFGDRLSGALFAGLAYGSIPSSFAHLWSKVKDMYKKILDKLTIVPIVGFFFGTIIYWGMAIAILCYIGIIFVVMDTIKFILKKPID